MWNFWPLLMLWSDVLMSRCCIVCFVPRQFRKIILQMKILKEKLVKNVKLHWKVIIYSPTCWWKVHLKFHSTHKHPPCLKVGARARPSLEGVNIIFSSHPLETWMTLGAILCFIFFFCMLCNFLNPQSASVIWVSAATLLCCEAPGMFCGL